jgi:hypothetical protein
VSGFLIREKLVEPFPSAVEVAVLFVRREDPFDDAVEANRLTQGRERNEFRFTAGGLQAIRAI